MIYRSNSASDTSAFGEAVGRACKKGDIYCLTGELGAGKTVFAKGFAAGLGVDVHITSPTFTLLNEYDGRLPLYHFDAYRLDGASTASCFDFEEYFYAGGVCLIEWADRLGGVIPENAVFINIERTNDGENTRVITVDPDADGMTKGINNGSCD